MEDVQTEDNGHSLPPVAEIRQAEKVTSSGNPKRTLVIFSIVLVIAVVAITVGAVVGSKNKNNNPAGANKSPFASAPTGPATAPSGKAQKATPAPVFASPPSFPSAPTQGSYRPKSTPAPQSTTLSLLQSLEGGDQFDNPTSYQSLALAWMEKTPFSDLTEKRIAQRYVLACIFYSTFQIRTAYTDVEYGLEVVPEWTSSNGWMTSEDECTWFGITCNANTKAVTRFDMPNNQMTGRFPAEIQLLNLSLEYLDISNNILDNKEEELEWIGEMTELRTLIFGYCYFEWPGVPSFLGNLILLEKLDMSFTLFHGDINAPVFAKLVNLKYLEMGGNSYNSTIPSEIYQLPLLERFYIQNSFVEGNLEFIKSMTEIFELWLDDNLGMAGTIPTEIGNLKTLESISFSGCNFFGQIPSEIGLLTGMQDIWLYNNDLTGTIPTQLGNLVNLQNFQTEGNGLHGTMPSEICINGGLYNGNLQFLATDCTGAGGKVECKCCDCCAFPCLYDE